MAFLRLTNAEKMKMLVSVIVFLGRGMLVSMTVFLGGGALFCLSVTNLPSSHLLPIVLGLSLLAVPF